MGCVEWVGYVWGWECMCVGDGDGSACVWGMGVECMCVRATWSILVYGCHWDVCMYVCMYMHVCDQLCRLLQTDIEELRRSNLILEEKGIVCVFFCKSTL